MQPQMHFVTAQNLWTPFDMTTLGFYKASVTSSITHSSGAVSQIDDLDGTEHLIQTETANKPTTGTRTYNGMNVLDHDGGDFMVKGSFPMPTSGDIAFFMFAQLDSINHTADSVFALRNPGAGNSNFQFDSNNATQFNGRIQTNNNGSQNLTGGPFAGPSIYALICDFTVNNEMYAYIDGTLRATLTGYNTKFQTSPLPSLTAFSNRGLSQFPDGFWGEYIVCEDITQATRENIEGYMSHEWGIEANLPVSHPYKDKPPTK